MDPPTPAQIVLRRMDMADASAVFGLQEALFHGDPNSLTCEQYGRIGSVGPVHVIIADNDTIPVGFIVLRNRPKRPWTAIDFIGILPGHTGKGIGRKLLEAAGFVASRPLLRLFVRPSNTTALALYAKSGFRHTGTRKKSYADGEDAFVQMKWVGLKSLRRKPGLFEKGL